MKLFEDKNHNHSKCSAKALAKALKYCEEKKINFSPIRKHVFEIIWGSHNSISAYDILNIIKKDNKKVVATTIYRALDFLETNNLVHKIHTNNTFIGCSYINEEHIPVLVICEKCGQVAEVYKKDMFKGVAKAISSSNFRMNNSTFEINGVCSECQKK